MIFFAVKQHLSAIGRHLPIDKSMDLLEKADLERMISSMRDVGLSANSIQSYTRTLKSFFSWCNEEELTKYIIGAIGMLDEPLSPKTKGDVSLLNYIKNITYEDLKKERSEVLNVTLNDIKALKPLIEEVLNQNILCTIGSESKVEQDKQLFNKVENLFK